MERGRHSGAHEAPGAAYDLWKKLVIGTGKPFAEVAGSGGNRYFFERAKFRVAHGDHTLHVTAEVAPDMNTQDDDGAYYWGVSWPGAGAGSFGGEHTAFRVGSKVIGRANAKWAAEACVREGIDAARVQARGPAISDDIPDTVQSTRHGPFGE